MRMVIIWKILSQKAVLPSTYLKKNLPYLSPKCININKRYYHSNKFISMLILANAVQMKIKFAKNNHKWWERLASKYEDNEVCQ